MPVLLRKAVVLCAFLAVVGATSGLNAQGDPKTALEQKLKEAFPLTKFSADKSEVVTAGAVVVLQKDKLMTYAIASPMPPINTYKNGKISQGWGGFGRDLLITTAAGGGGTANDYPHQQYVTGQTLWVGQISVSTGEISLVLVSDPDANNVRYYGQLNIPFHKKGEVPSSDDGLKSVSEVLTVQPAHDNSAQQQIPAPNPPAQEQAPTPPPPLAPPPPPTDAPPATPAAPATPKTISLGQTKDQVIASFGQPQKVAHVGTKEIDYYPDMKVTFVNGKVTGVQ